MEDSFNRHYENKHGETNNNLTFGVWGRALADLLAKLRKQGLFLESSILPGIEQSRPALLYPTKLQDMVSHFLMGSLSKTFCWIYPWEKRHILKWLSLEAIRRDHREIQLQELNSFNSFSLVTICVVDEDRLLFFVLGLRKDLDMRSHSANKRHYVLHCIIHQKML